MKPIQLPAQTAAQLEALDELYRTTKDVRLRQRAQLVLLAAEKGLVATEIGAIVSGSGLNWFCCEIGETLSRDTRAPETGAA